MSNVLFDPLFGRHAGSHAPFLTTADTAPVTYGAVQISPPDRDHEQPAAQRDGHDAKNNPRETYAQTAEPTG